MSGMASGISQPLSAFSTLLLAESLNNEGSQSTNTPPISKLHPDLLWRIFSVNANMYDDVLGKKPDSRAFNHTFHASQVCRDWRDLIIYSPSLWARIIDINILWVIHNDLQKEVLHRTGDAPLSIKGEIYANHSPDNPRRIPPKFIYSLLNNEWARIRVFDITIKRAATVDLFIKGIFNPSSWHALRSPAPSLEIFRLQIPENAYGQIPHPHQIFGESAPLLREFQFSGLPIGIDTPWLGHLRHLNISFALPRVQIVNILEKTPTLEVLVFDENVIVFPANVDDRRVSLPRLMEIQVLNAGEISLDVLERIIPGPGCSLLLSSENINQIMYSVGRPAAKSVISRYAHGYFDGDDQTLAGRTALLYFAFHKRSIGFSHDSNAFLTPYLPKCSVYASSSGVDLCEELIALFFESISSCILHYLDTLHLSIMPNAAAPPIDPVLKSFFLSFKSVKKLRTTPDILELLLDIPKEDAIILPSLRTVEIVDSYQGLGREHVLLFLLWRAEMGIPIETLDLTQCRNLAPPHLKFLELMEGLKVLWKSEGDDQIKEYVCGKAP